MILDILDMELKFILKLKHIITDIKDCYLYRINLILANLVHHLQCWIDPAVIFPNTICLAGISFLSLGSY